ncbi:MAG TPA: hypothetical protein VN823_21790 [Stellaceae bacterium]|nr:hypothetical protein [Stellaceae bacterium]
MGFLASLRADFGPAEAAPAGGEPAQLGFWRGLPPSVQAYLADDIKLLIGWTFDAAAAKRSFQGGELIDNGSGVSRVPGFAAPTPMTGLKGRYRVLRPPFERGGGYYGIELAALDDAGATVAVLLTNRLFRMPIALQDPLGLATDIVTNGAMLAGIKTGAVADAATASETAYADARQSDVPLLIGGQSQAGGTAQLQTAYLQSRYGGDAPVGFITMNAAHVLLSVKQLGLGGEQVHGINFSKDLDPGVGPKAPFANRVGFQVYIHPDGSGSRTPGNSTLADAMLHPREHLLDSFTKLSLTAALQSALAE